MTLPLLNGERAATSDSNNGQGFNGEMADEKKRESGFDVTYSSEKKQETRSHSDNARESGNKSYPSESITEIEEKGNEHRK